MSGEAAEEGQKPLRVLHVLQHFGIGGVQSQCADRLNLLPDCIHQDVAALNGDLSMRASVRDRSCVCFIAAPQPRRGQPYFLTLLPWLRRQQSDLVVTYGWGTMDVLVAAPLAGLRNVLHEVHGFGPAELPHQLTRRLWARRLLFRTISSLVVPSRTMQRVARETWHLPVNSITFLPCGIDTKRFRPGEGAGAALRATLGIPDHAFVVGNVGRLDPVKDLDHLVDAVAALDRGSEVHLVLVGEGGERARLTEQATDLGIGDRVHLVGFAADPAPYYAIFDAYALTSRSEQRPVALMEAMACGLPVVATDVGDVTDMIAAANLPFVVPYGDRDALRDALARLQSDPGLRRALGSDNRRRCEAEFDLAHVIAAYCRLYQTAVAGNGGSSA